MRIFNAAILCSCFFIVALGYAQVPDPNARMPDKKIDESNTKEVPTKVTPAPTPCPDPNPPGSPPCPAPAGTTDKSEVRKATPKNRPAREDNQRKTSPPSP